MRGQAEAEARIRSMLERMYGHVMAMYEALLKALRDGDNRARREVEERLLVVEELRQTITLETLLFMARWQPLGRDLLRAEDYIRAAYGLFRVARYLREIARLNDVAGPLVGAGVSLEPLMKAMDMVDKAFKSMLTWDEKLAEQIMEADREIDEYYESSLSRLSRDPVPRRDAIEAVLARHVERIADHATYIAQLTRPGPPL